MKRCGISHVIPAVCAALLLGACSGTPETRFYTLLRPPTDEDLPNVWGLPAATLRPGETWADAIKRIGLEKLGVQLKVGGELQHGSIERRNLPMHVTDSEELNVLGMNFLSSLGSWRVEGTYLVLRA